MDEPVENPEIICACCRATITRGWVTTAPSGFVTCDAGGCEYWARARGERIYTLGVLGQPAPPAARPLPRTRRRPTCDHCGQPRRSAKDAFPVDERAPDGHRLTYCTLTCKQAAAS